jgi:hypothetical protein
MKRTQIEIAETEIAETEIAETEIAEIEIAEIEIAEIVEIAGIEIAETEIAGIEIAGIEIAGIEIAEIEIVEIAGIEITEIETAATRGTEDVQMKAGNEMTEVNNPETPRLRTILEKREIITKKVITTGTETILKEGGKMMNTHDSTLNLW